MHLASVIDSTAGRGDRGTSAAPEKRGGHQDRAAPGLPGRPDRDTASSRRHRLQALPLPGGRPRGFRGQSRSGAQDRRPRLRLDQELPQQLAPRTAGELRLRGRRPQMDLGLSDRSLLSPASWYQGLSTKASFPQALLQIQISIPAFPNSRSFRIGIS
jgi:hypothetical protein